MKRSKFTDSQIMEALKRVDAGGLPGHSMRVGAAQDLLRSGASMPMIMNKGRWSKTDTVMRYLENTSSF